MKLRNGYVMKTSVVLMGNKGVLGFLRSSIGIHAVVQ